MEGDLAAGAEFRAAVTVAVGSFLALHAFSDLATRWMTVKRMGR